ncbi:Atxe2 family lasso peptide isopeptidase [Pseudoxanthomonas sp. UTMC 1351]|uniref:Atxe2 family lasso peptide isopeptidase n=1 Tax=Pseudoxanthomonas sp. UTMC 1351 TaxID=2695853 RepID=UPI0034CDE456
MRRSVLAFVAILAAGMGAAPADAIAPRRLVEVADFSGVTMSHDGQRVAFRIEQASVERNTYDSVWYVQGMDGAPPLRVADGGTPLREQTGLAVPAPAVWSPDGRWIYYRALLDGRIDVWRAATDGSGAEPMTREPADVRAFSLSSDGRELIYRLSATREEVVAAEQGEYDQGIRIDRTVPLGQGVFRSGFVDGRLATQRLRDNEVIRHPLLADVPDRWRAVDLATGKRRDLAPRDIPPAPLTAPDLAAHLTNAWILSQDPASGRIALLMRTGERNGLRDRPGVQLSMLPGRSARVPVKCQAEACRGKTISAIQWRPSTDEVLFTVGDPGEGHAQSMHRWNVNTGDVQPVVRTRGLLNGGVRLLPSDCALSATLLACVIAEADRPPYLERIDIETGARQTLFDPNPALTKDMAETRVRLLRWTDAEGREFTGQFYPAKRSGGNLPPLFVSYYWCKGFVRGGLGEELPFASFAENGISALCINLAPNREDAVAQYEQGRAAVESAVALLASTGQIDRARVGMGGLSLGAEITMWTAMHSQILTAASVSSLGLSPLYYLLLSNFGEAFHSRLWMGWQLGALDETPERWRKFSPVFNLDRIQAPVLMQLPEQEYIHSLDYAVPLMRKGMADMYVFPNEPHQKFQPRHKLAVYERNLDWFRFWLLGNEDTSPAKRPQYAHWRLMKAGMRGALGHGKSGKDR